MAVVPALPSFKGRPGWEFTSLEGFELDAYATAEGGDRSVLSRMQPVLQGIEGAVRVDQVDGAWAPVDGAVPEGPLVMSLSQALCDHPEIVERHLGTIVTGDDAILAASEAGWTGGAFVYVPRGVKVQAPIVLHAVQDAATAMHWRVLVVLEESAEAEIWDQHLSSGDGDGQLFTSIVELSVGQASRLRYVCAQGLGEKAWVFGNQRAVVGRDADLSWIALGFGAAQGRVAMETKLAGRGANARVTGAYATRGRQHLDYATTQEHAAPNTTSDLAFRGILDGRSHTVWSGMIKVDPGAQQIDAFQESRNLLLTKRAHADAIPGLEILANDVRCTHAAAIAQIDHEQLFYLRSHGLREPDAKRLIIEGFLQATVERFEEGAVREAVAGALDRRLGAVLG